jgi:hypothetical protein
MPPSERAAGGAAVALDCAAQGVITLDTITTPAGRFTAEVADAPGAPPGGGAGQITT